MIREPVSVLAQNAPEPVRAERDCDNNVIVRWSPVGGASSYTVSAYNVDSGTYHDGGSTGDTSQSIGKLGSGSYYIDVYSDGGAYGTATVKLGRAYCPRHTLPPQFSCAEMTDRLVVHAIGQGTNCQSVIPGGVGDAGLIAAGVLDAIDLWGAHSEVRFCFLKRGRLKFVDTATLPRVVSDLPATYIDGITCGSVDRTGMVVLLRADETAIAVRDTSVAPVAPVAVAADSVDFCQLSTTGSLSLRAGPSVFYARLDTMPIGTRLRGAARNGDWFLVKFSEQWGWSSGEHLTQSPGCDAIGESSRVYFSLEDESTPVDGEMPREEPPEPAQPESPEPDAYVLIDCRLTAGDIINLRTEPGTEHSIEAEIPYRTQLIAVDRVGDWFKVEFAGKMGWVNLAYVFRRGACG